jgi:hypothetical protein
MKFNLFDHVLRLLVLFREDIAHTEVGQDDGLTLQEVVTKAGNDLFVLSYGFILLAFLHVDRVSEVYIKNKAVSYDLLAVLEQLLNGFEIFDVPVNLGLVGQNCNILLFHNSELRVD